MLAFINFIIRDKVKLRNSLPWQKNEYFAFMRGHLRWFKASYTDVLAS